MPYEGLIAETVNIRGHNGDLIDAYLARPLGSGPFPGVVMIHHMPGWDEATKEMARKLAHNGIVCISPNLHFREGQGDPTANSASVREAGGMPDDRTLGDVAGARDYLRTLPYHNDKVGVIGFCSGGRQTYLVACRLDGINAAVNCWGGGVTTVPEGELERSRQPDAPVDFTSGLNCPLLGLFGNEDARPSPQDVNDLEAALQAAGKVEGEDYEFFRYDNAGHGFFAVDRPSYRQEAAVDGWKQVLRFYNTHLAAGAREMAGVADDD